MFRLKFMVMVALATLSTTTLAQDYVINVNGIVCEFCALGVTKKVSKLDFIDRTKFNKGVDVQVENQMVTIAVKPEATLDKEALFAAIESAGYNPVTIFELAADGSRVELGTN